MEEQTIQWPNEKRTTRQRVVDKTTLHAPKAEV